MSENIGVSTLTTSNSKSTNDKKRLKQHAEFIFALTGGGFLLTGLLLQTMDFHITSIIFFLISYSIGGYYKAKEGLTELINDRSLNVEILMLLAAIGAAIIGYWVEGAILIFIFSLSGALETFTLNKSHREISSLMKLQPEEAVVLTEDHNETVVDVASLNIGDHVLIKPGERVPTDGKIIKGQTTINESTITGEAIPVTKTLNSDVFAGTVNLNGSIIVSVTKTNDETLFQKIIELVQTAKDEKPPSQLFIEKFEATYVKSVLVVVILMMVLPPYLLSWSWTETFYRAMVLLVVASPCALVASIMPASLSAISNGARNGILFKGGVHLEALSTVQSIAFDKTGTLTNGEPQVTDVIVREGLELEEFIHTVASIESHSSHPLAEAIVQYAKQKKVRKLTQPDSIEDVTGWGVTAQLQGKDYKVGKKSFVEQSDVGSFNPLQTNKLTEEGKTLVYVADEIGICGVIALKDTIRDVSVTAVERFRQAGIHTVMITGDQQQTAKAIADQTKVHEYISNCLPEEKVDVIKRLKKKYGSVVMVGDGINDAPALATANVGIAMGTGTDVAIETADIVLIKNDLSKIVKAINLSKRMNRIIKQNIIFSITVIVLLITTNFLQHLSLPLGVIGHEGSTILVILNGLRLLRG